MPGCGFAPDDCAPQQPDSLDPAIEDLVKDFIDAVWNHSWTAGEYLAAQPLGPGGDPRDLPQVTEDALTNYMHQDYERHRRDGSGTRKMETGIAGFRKCIYLVHCAVTDLKVTVLDIVACGDCVTVLLLLEGTDVRPDGLPNMPGLFGAAQPTGRRYRFHTAALFCMEDNRIKGDYLLYGADLLRLGESQVGHQP